MDSGSIVLFSVGQRQDVRGFQVYLMKTFNENVVIVSNGKRHVQ
jgi:hypothetical protein